MKLFTYDIASVAFTVWITQDEHRKHRRADLAGSLNYWQEINYEPVTSYARLTHFKIKGISK